MKAPAAVLCIIISARCAAAEDIETLNHNVYKNAKITRAEPDGIVVQHAAGIVKIPFDELPAEMQERYHYNESEGAAFRKNEAARQQSLYEQTERAKRARAAQNAEENTNVDADNAARAARRAIAGFSLDANEVGTGASEFDTWRTSWGSHDTTQQQNERIVIRIHDVGRSSAKCVADVYFVGKQANVNVYFIYAHEAVPITNGSRTRGEGSRGGAHTGITRAGAESTWPELCERLSDGRMDRNWPSRRSSVWKPCFKRAGRKRRDSSDRRVYRNRKKPSIMGAPTTPAALKLTLRARALTEVRVRMFSI